MLAILRTLSTTWPSENKTEGVWEVYNLLIYQILSHTTLGLVKIETLEMSYNPRFYLASMPDVPNIGTGMLINHVIRKRGILSEVLPGLPWKRIPWKTYWSCRNRRSSCLDYTVIHFSHTVVNKWHIDGRIKFQENGERRQVGLIQPPSLHMCWVALTMASFLQDNGKNYYFHVGYPSHPKKNNNSDG